MKEGTTYTVTCLYDSSLFRVEASGWRGEAYGCSMETLSKLDLIDHLKAPGVFLIATRTRPSQCQWVGGGPDVFSFIVTLPKWEKPKNCWVLVIPTMPGVGHLQINYIVKRLSNLLNPVHPPRYEEFPVARLRGQSMDKPALESFVGEVDKLAQAVGFPRSD